MSIFIGNYGDETTTGATTDAFNARMRALVDGVTEFGTPQSLLSEIAENFESGADYVDAILDANTSGFGQIDFNNEGRNSSLRPLHKATSIFLNDNDPEIRSVGESMRNQLQTRDSWDPNYARDFSEANGLIDPAEIIDGGGAGGQSSSQTRVMEAIPVVEVE